MILISEGNSEIGAHICVVSFDLFKGSLKKVSGRTTKRGVGKLTFFEAPKKRSGIKHDN